MNNKVIFNLVVWGSKYTSWFCEYSLPSLLSLNNLPSIQINDNSKFQIITTTTDWDYLNKNKNFIKLKKIIQVEFINIFDHVDSNGLNESEKYAVMTKGQCCSLENSLGFDVIFWLYADLIWADGAVKKALNHLYNDKNAVFSPGPICDFLKVKEYLKSYNLSIIKSHLDGKNLVSLALNSLHTICSNNLASNNYVSITPSYRIWALDDKGFIMHNFHLHMVCQRTSIIKKKGINKFEGSLDGDLIPLMFDSLVNLHITEGSDDVFFISLADNYDQGLTFEENSPKNVATWAERNTEHIHKLFYSKYIVFKNSRIKQTTLFYQTENCKQFISEVDKFLMMPDLLKYNYNFKGFLGRIEKVASMLNPPNLIEIKEKIFKILKSIGVI